MRLPCRASLGGGGGGGHALEMPLDLVQEHLPLLHACRWWHGIKQGTWYRREQQKKVALCSFHSAILAMVHRVQVQTLQAVTCLRTLNILGPGRLKLDACIQQSGCCSRRHAASVAALHRMQLPGRLR